MWIVGILPSPLRQIAAVLLILWILALFGIIVIAGISNLLVLAVIIGLVLFVLGIV
jgi:hypothetical protein